MRCLSLLVNLVGVARSPRDFPRSVIEQTDATIGQTLKLIKICNGPPRPLFQQERTDMTQIVSLEGRTVVVTGAAQGIGKAIVEWVIDLGGNAVAVDLNAEGLKAVVDALPSDRVLAVVGSVADPELATRAVTDAVERFGAVHGLVNNAGIIRPAMIEKITLKK
jgi:FlaA1/EpsC-like NDP-sugar epimerase